MNTVIKSAADFDIEKEAIKNDLLLHLFKLQQAEQIDELMSSLSKTLDLLTFSYQELATLKRKLKGN